VMDYFIVAVLVAICMACLMASWIISEGRLASLKAENERLNQKLQRHNPRDAHGRFTKDK